MRVIGESDIMQEFLSESDEVCVSFIVVLILGMYLSDVLFLILSPFKKILWIFK